MIIFFLIINLFTCIGDFICEIFIWFIKQVRYIINEWFTEDSKSNRNLELKESELSIIYNIFKIIDEKN